MLKNTKTSKLVDCILLDSGKQTGDYILSYGIEFK